MIPSVDCISLMLVTVPEVRAREVTEKRQGGEADIMFDLLDQHHQHRGRPESCSPFSLVAQVPGWGVGAEYRSSSLFSG